MKTIPQILRALDRLSSLTVQGRKNERPGAFFARMHFVDGMRRCAMELANWIVHDDRERTKLAEMLDELQVEELKLAKRQRLTNNGRAMILSVYLDFDLVARMAELNIRASDAINNGLALYYLHQFRQSQRIPKRESSLERQLRGPYRCSLDEDLYERLEEHVSETHRVFGGQKSRSAIVNGALRLYLWVQDLLGRRDGDSCEGEPCGTLAG